jgi:hypothetical protein
VRPPSSEAVPCRSVPTRVLWIVVTVAVAIALAALTTTCTGPRPQPTGQTIQPGTTTTLPGQSAPPETG